MDIGSLIVGAIVGAIPSWFISKSFSDESSKELETQLNNHASKIESATTFNSFERMLRTSNWKKEHIGHGEIWVCEKNNTFQIHMCDDDREFKESWTSVFPDQNTTMFHVNLTIGGTIVKSLPFISADGGRYTLPLPELAVIDGKPSFFWSSNSVEVRVAEIIGNFYRYGSLGEVAEFTKVELHTVTKNA
jgi:hypothetical protein